MKLGSQEAFQNLRRKMFMKRDQSETFQPRKYTTLNILQQQETGIFAPRRKNYVQLFKEFSFSVIPNLEKQIEIDLLRHQFRSIKSEVVKQSLIQAYIRRLAIIKNLEMDQDKIKEEPQDFEVETLPERKNVIAATTMNAICNDHIGYYVQFKKTDFLKYFKNYAPGNWKEKSVQFSKHFALQLTEEGVKLMNLLQYQQRSDNIFEYIEQLQGLNLEEKVYNEEVFQVLFATLRGDFKTCLDAYRNDTILHRLFVNAPVFDSIISFISIIIFHMVQIKVKEISMDQTLFNQLKDPQQRNKILQTLVKEIKNKRIDLQQVNAHLPELFFKTVKTLRFGDKQIDLSPYMKAPYIVPKSFEQEKFSEFVNCGNSVLIYGKQGTGKSGVLMQTAMFAIESGWVVIVVPSAYNWTQIHSDFERHHDTGLFIQPKYAQEFLEQFTQANAEVLSKIPVNMSLYGKYNFSGVHDNDVDPVPNVYDPIRKYHFKDYEKFIDKEEIQFMGEQSLNYSVRLKDLILPNPQTVKEIADAALANPKFCTSAIYEILEQLYKQDTVPVLEIVDGVNWFYKPSKYPSYRYESDPGLKGYIPPYHFSLCRAFMHLDGHKIRNGYKIMASQIYPLHNNIFTPDMIHLPKNYSIELKGLPLDHYRIFCQFCTQNRVWLADNYQQTMIDQFWMETQGNIGETVRCMQMNWRDI